MDQVFRKKIHRIFPKLVIIIAVVFLSNCVQLDTEKQLITHTLSVSKEIELLQTLHSVYPYQNDFQPTIAGSSGLVCILGDIAYPPQQKIVCLDSHTGALSWQRNIGTASGIIVVPNEIYITYGGGAGVERYDFAGDTIWSRSFKGTNAVYAYVDDELIHLFMHPERYLTLERNTGTLVEEQKNEEVIFSTDTVNYVRSFGIEARSKDLNQLFWHMKLPHDIRLAPVFAEDVIFLRTGRTHGAIICVDRNTGEILWKTEENIISTLAYSSDLKVLFALNNEEELVAIQKTTGRKQVLANFLPSFPSNDEPWEQFQLAFDDGIKILSVFLGDSKQLFILDLINFEFE